MARVEMLKVGAAGEVACAAESLEEATAVLSGAYGQTKSNRAA